jgi:putative transposase
MYKVWEYKLKPNVLQAKWFDDMLWHTKCLYNVALEERIKFYKDTGKSLNLFVQDKGYNKQTWPQLPAVLVDTTLARLDNSYQNFFRRVKNGEKAGFPRFKSIRRWNSFSFRDYSSGKIYGNRWHVSRMMSVKIILHRPWEGTPKFTRLVKKADGYYVQLTTEQPDVPEKPLTEKSRCVGLDVGIKNFVADSDGKTVSNPAFLKSSLKKLAYAQRLLSKGQKGGKRRKKKAHKVAVIHKKITDQRMDFLHKTAKKYADGYDAVFVENLNIKGMSKMRTLSRSISDASWSKFFSVLQDKLKKLGKTYGEVPPHYTSQKCSSCGEMVQKSLSVRTHICPHCGYMDDRDVNAARNILRLGLVRAFGEEKALAFSCDPRSPRL